MSIEDAIEEIAAGQIVKFLGYGETPEVQVLKKGAYARIVSSDPDEEGAYDVESLDGKLEDVLFPEEFEAIDYDEAEEAEAYAAEAKEDEKKNAVDDERAKKVLKVKKAPAKKAPTAKKKAPAKKVPAEKVPAEKVPAEKREEAPVAKPSSSPAPLALTDSAREAIGSADPVRVAYDLQKKSAQNDFILGGVLAKIEDEKLHENFVHPETGKEVSYTGAKGFAGFTEEFLGTGYRKARYLIDINRTFAGTGVDEMKLAAIGWSKLKNLTDVSKRMLALDGGVDRVEELLEEAASMTTENLDKELETYRQELNIERGKGASSSNGKLTTFTVKLFNDHAEQLDAALDAAKGSIEIDEDDTEAAVTRKCLMFIIDEWMQARG